MIWIIWIMTYVLVGGFIGYMGRRMALGRCEYSEVGHKFTYTFTEDKYFCRRNHADDDNRKFLGQPNCVHTVRRSCGHNLAGYLFGGFFWPVYGPVLLGRELSRIIPDLPELRHNAKLEKVRRTRQLAEEQLRIAQIDAERKRIEARGTDEQLRGLGLLDRMGENPYDRESNG